MSFLKGLALGLLGFLLFISMMMLGLAVTLNSTLLSANFVKNEIKQLDLHVVAQEVLKDMLPSEMQSQLGNIDSLITEVKPWLDSQIDYLVTAGYHYLKDRSAELNLVIETDSVKPVIIKWATDTYLPTLTPDQTQGKDINQLTEEFKQELDKAIPSLFKIDAELLGAENMRVLGEVKKAIGIWQTGFFLLCVLTALWIVLIIVILRKIKDILRSLGINFLIAGILGVIDYFVLLYVSKAIPVEDIPQSVHAWAMQFLHNLMTPWGIYFAVLLVAGLGMLIASFFILKSKVAEAQPEATLPAAN
jgi:hypothetical protein